MPSIRKTKKRLKREIAECYNVAKAAYEAPNLSFFQFMIVHESNMERIRLLTQELENLKRKKKYETH